MKRKLFCLLTLLLTVCSGAWANQTNLITGITLPDVPTGTIDVSSVEVSKENGWYLMMSPKTNLTSSLTWYKGIGTNGGSSSYNIPSGTVAPYTSGKQEINRYTVQKGGRSHAIRFTGVETASFLGNYNSDTRKTCVSLFSYDGETQSLVETKSVSSSIGEMVFTELSKSTNYIAYIYGSDSNNSDFYGFALKAPTIPSLTGAWKIENTDVTGETANIVQGSAAPTMPTFTIGATSETPTASDYSVSYEVTGTAGIFTLEAGVPTGISTATAGTATVTATLTTNDASKFLSPDPNTFEYTVTVSPASAPTISVTGESSAARGADAIVLTAEVTGTPTPTIEWFKCDDALKTNPVSQGKASTANTTFNVATTTVGTYFYYAVANNGNGGDGDHNVFSDVKTITIVPKAPILTGSYFLDTKEVDIVKADGEDASAVIKYSTDGGANWEDFSASFDIDATTTVLAKVVQSTLESALATATYTKYVLSNLTPISSETTWNWTSWNESLTLTVSSTPTISTEATYSDIATLNSLTLPSGFNGNALAFTGQYPVRSKASQAGTSWKFNTTVPGTITVNFADTGSSGSSSDRYLTVNGVKTNYYANRNADDDAHGKGGKTVTTGAIPVSAGDVVLSSANTEGWVAIRIMKIVFTPATATVTTNAGNWASFTPEWNCTLEDGAKAYIITGVNGSTLTGEEVAVLEGGKGYFIKGEVASHPYTATATDADATSTDRNLVVGCATSTEINGSGNTKYILGTNASGAGLFYVDSSITIPAGKAYLDAGKVIDAPARALSLDFEEGETTALSEVRGLKSEVRGEYFNLNGQRVAQPTKGLYIVNGRKVVIK